MHFAQQVRFPASIAQSLSLTSIQRGWQVNPSSETVVFSKKGDEKVEIPKEKLIIAALNYARELEQIV